MQENPQTSNGADETTPSDIGDSCELVFGTHVLLGWGCCQSRHYNGLQRETCKVCGHKRCAPLTIPADLKQAVYCEEGGRTQVEIVHTWFEDQGAWEDFNLRLRAIETIETGRFGALPVGKEFSVSVNVQYVGSPMRCWSLETVEKENPNATLNERRS